MGRPLLPVARLTTNRRRVELRSADGHRLAEVDHDSVIGTRLLGESGAAGEEPVATGPAHPAASPGPPGPSDLDVLLNASPSERPLASPSPPQPGSSSVLGPSSPDLLPPSPGLAGDAVPTRTGDGPVGPGPEVRFDEVEVELAEGAPPSVLRATSARLQAAGARPSARASKLAEVLGLPPGARRRRAAALGPASSMAAVLQAQLSACLETVLKHDPAIRLGDPDPEHVHRARVATRTLRSLLRTFGPQTDDPWLSGLREELRWLADQLGHARDADVRMDVLRAECSSLPPTDALGVAELLELGAAEQRSSHEALGEALRSERYLALLRTLDTRPLPAAIAAQPVLAQAVQISMPPLVRRQWHSLRRSVAGLGDNPSDGSLHKVRIKAKHQRYASEAAAAVVAPAKDRTGASRAAKAATALQDVLGELHDNVVLEAWLREAAGKAPRSRANGAGGASGSAPPATASSGAATASLGHDVLPALRTGRQRTAGKVALALVAGQLVAEARQRQNACRAAWPAIWAQLARRSLHRWSKP